jgi:hypothetical protein
LIFLDLPTGEGWTEVLNRKPDISLSHSYRVVR